MKYGYGRCSTNETKQDIQRQIRELKAAGAEMVYTEYEHGDSENKKALNDLLASVATGDTIMATEVSRLTRSTKQLCDLIEQIKAKRLCLVILNSMTIDCRSGSIDPMTEAFLTMAGVFSQLEKAMICSRVKSGVENARAKGKRLGRPTLTKEDLPEGFYKHYTLFKQGALNKLEFSRVLNVSRPTLDKYIKLVEG